MNRSIRWSLIGAKAGELCSLDRCRHRSGFGNAAARQAANVEDSAGGPSVRPESEDSSALLRRNFKKVLDSPGELWLNPPPS